MRYTFLTLTSLLTTLHALTITYPNSGVSVDPSQPITIKWTSTSSDPSTINLVFTNNGAQQQLGSNVATSSGSYTVPANTIITYGAGFTISAQSSGNTVATSGTFILAYGGTIVTNSNGGKSLVATGPTAAASTTASSIVFQTTGLEGQSVTATYISGSSTDTGATTATASTDTGRPFTTHGPQSFSTTLGSSTVSRSSSTASSSATSASTQNAQPRVMVGKEVMSVAGFLAGLVALVA